MTARRRFLTGDRVVVRSHAEILETLDASGTLDGLPFMAEMVQSCGKPFRIQRRVDRTCVAAHRLRRFAANDVVILDGPRCDGSGHDGCGHGCRIFWKEAWLRSDDGEAAPAASAAADAAKLRARLKAKADERRYFCQSTELLKATEAFPGKQRPWIARLLLREIRNHELSIGRLLRMIADWSRMRVWRLRGGNKRLQGSRTRTPTASLDLKPGELVRVKSLDQIAATLNHKSRNRGLGICLEMSRLCGREAEVRYRVQCLIDERTGIMRPLTNTVALHNVRGGDKTLGEECLCYGEIGDCPRGEIMYWREIWLDRVDGS
jgi:hypothetical protein